MNIIQLKHFEDSRGYLLPIEFNNLPFTPRRIFVVNNVPLNTNRGNHSHLTTQQLIICTKGKVDVILHNGIDEKIYRLKQFEQILVPSLVWDTQTFLTLDAEILVLCSTLYDAKDYILSFDKFKKIKKNILSKL